MVETPGRRVRVEGFGVDDESAGYQARHTSWHWSAGVGTAADGRALAWNLVEGINDPPERSERAIWVDGVPHEPAPVAFDGLDAVRFADGSRLDFEPAAPSAPATTTSSSSAPPTATASAPSAAPSTASSWPRAAA